MPLDPYLFQLSKREREVLRLLLQGKSNKQIALSLNISVRTVEFHLTNIYAKLQVGSRFELVLKLGVASGSVADKKLGYSTVDGPGEKTENKGRLDSRMGWAEFFRDILSVFYGSPEMKKRWSSCLSRVPTSIRVLAIFAVVVTTLLLVRAFVYTQLTYTPLPIAEPLTYHFLTVITVGLASALVSLIQRERGAVVWSALAAFTAYLGWAIIQQNLIINPDIWKLWERGWLTVALACGVVAFALTAALQFIVKRFVSNGPSIRQVKQGSARTYRPNKSLQWAGVRASIVAGSQEIRGRSISECKSRLSRPFVFSGPILLTTAHLVTLVALLSFGTRAGGYPLGPTGILIYGIVTVVALFGLVMQSRQAELSSPQSLLWISLPVLVSFLFWIGLGGTYAPYDPHDSDLVRLSYLLFSLLFSLVGVLYGSPIYLGIACITQVTLYLCTYALPNYLHYPSAGLLGPQPSLFAALIGVYLAGMGLLFLRRAMVGQHRPEPWLAAVLTSGIGSCFLYQMLIWLPDNGAYLGYIVANTYVPAQAWNWIRTVAEFIAAATVVVAVLSGVLALLQAFVSRRHIQLSGERAA